VVRWKIFRNPATGERRREGGLPTDPLEDLREPGSGGTEEGKRIGRSIGRLSGTRQRGNERGKVDRPDPLEDFQEPGSGEMRVGRWVAKVHWKTFRNPATGK